MSAMTVYICIQTLALHCLEDLIVINFFDMLIKSKGGLL